ncbi:MAG: hypothetical protein U1G07_20895 [Verrucomicrobiota bacterium]
MEDTSWSDDSGQGLSPGPQDNEADQNAVTNSALHAGFRLSQEGEAIALFASDGSLLDSVTFGPQTNNVSQGRSPDGSTSITYLPVATPGASNPSSILSHPVAAGVCSSTGQLMLSWSAHVGQTYRIQTREDLGGGTWLNVIKVVAGSTTEMRAILLNGSSHAFYRVVMGE